MSRRAERGSGVVAFSLVELLVVIAIITILISILLPGLCMSRGASRQAKCTANMKQLALGNFNYASDTRGWLAAFSWQPGKAYSQWAELNNATSPTDAHCNQSTDIVRRVTGRMQPKFNGRMMARNFTYLVLVDGGYFGGDKLPELGVSCPEDRLTVLMQRTQPEQVQQVGQSGAPDWHTPQYNMMLPYWSSYQLVPAVWATDFGPPRISQSTTDYRLYSFSPTQTRFQNRRIDDFAFPSQKVVFFDLFDRHTKCNRTQFFGYPDAKQPLIFADASVQTKRTGDSNKGWNPNNHLNLSAVTTYTYRPMVNGDPPSRNAAGDQIIGYYRWTRWGVRGVDFNGREPTKRP